MEANLPLNEISELSCPSEAASTTSEFMSGLFSSASTNELSSVNNIFPVLTSLSLPLTLHRPGGSVNSLHVSQNI